MLPSHVPLPLPYRLLDQAAQIAVRAGVRFTRLSISELEDAACRRTDLTDFGNPYYREGLSILLESIQLESQMHTYGKAVMRIILINYLSQRLLFTQSRKQQAAIYRSPAPNPLIITGLHRSGTTFLHHLLSADPRSIGIPFWQMFRPFKTSTFLDLRRTMNWIELSLLRPLFSGLDQKHPLRPFEPEEDIWMMGLTFHSIVFWIIAPVYGYTRWLINNDRRQAYLEYGLLVRWLQAQYPDRQLILKAPDHLGNLDLLLEAVPNANIIQLQRDPETCTLSLSSLLYSSHKLFTSELNPALIHDINQLLTKSALEMSEGIHERLGNKATSWISLPLNQLAEDPLTTLRDIYHTLNWPWCDRLEEKFTHQIEAENRHRKAHTYSRAQFGVE